MTIPVAAAIIKRGDLFLITRRASHKHLAGFWEFPGGKIETDETPEVCILRELQEELKIEVEVMSFLAEHVHDYGTIKILLKAYICLFIRGEFTLVDHDAVQWVTKDQLKLYAFAPADLPFLKLIS
jgi:8-oxo-dGTP diphosphatase